jgi:ACS family sodium-dependent inorganic phosphate cotransporter
VDLSAEYSYTPEDKGNILSAFAGGYLLTQVVGGMMADRYGGKPMLLIGLVTSSMALLLLPLASDAGIHQLWWLLWLMGLMQGPTYPAQLVTTARWATGSLSSYASALGGAGSTGGSLLALGLTPVFAARVGWRSTSWFFGVVTLVFGIVWQLFGQSAPYTRKKLRVVNGHHHNGHHHAKRTVADKLRVWLHLLTAPTVLVIFGAHSVHNFVRYFLMAWMPTYYRDVLMVSADAAGVQQVLPELCGLFTSIVSASMSREIQSKGLLSPLSMRRLFAGSSFLGQGLGLLAVAAATSARSVTLFLCLVQGVSTLQGLGWGANYLEISLYHGGLVTGVGNSVATAASFLAPIVASQLLAGEEATSSAAWRRLFICFASSSLSGLLFYVPFCSTEAVDAKVGEGTDNTKKDA